jgi:hypothetical protein
MKRWVTDIPFLVGFLAFWMGMIVCTSMGLSEGDLTRLLYFVDYNGNRCGEGALEDYKYTHWTHWANSATNVCVKECPGQYHNFKLENNYIGTANASANIGYTTSASTLAACTLATNAFVSCTTQGSAGSLIGGAFSQCCTFDASPAPDGLYICVPKSVTSGASSAAQEYVDQSATIIAAAVGDLVAGWWIILASAAIAFLMAFIYTFILKYSAACFVYSVVALSNIAMWLVTAMLFYLYDVYSKAYDDTGLSGDEQMKYLCLVALIIVGIMAFVLTCMTACMCRQIRIAVGIIEAACEAVQAMPLITLYPLVGYFWMCCFVIYWVIIAAYMASSGEYVKDELTGVYTMQWNEDMQKAATYFFFGFLWNMAFIRHMTILILAGAFGVWYWTPLPKKEAGEFHTEHPRPILSSVCRSITYHFGTVAFGSFIIAVIQFIQYVLEYIKKKQDSKYLKWIITCIQAYVKCFERVMEYISKCAYIVTACKGNMFCTAAWASFKFLWKHLGQHAVVQYISYFLLGLGKIFVVAFTLAISALLCGTNSDLSSPYVVLVICAVIAYLVSSLFMGVIDTGIDTILVCFCWELDANGAMENKEGEKMVYGTKGLVKFISGAKKTAEELSKGGGGGEASAPEVTEVQPAAATEGGQ